MKTRRFFGLLISCLFVLGCLAAPARAVVISDSEVQEVITRATGQFEETIPAQSIMPLGADSVPLDSGEVISYNCTYTPKSASLDFGFIAPDGYFYSINCTSGSINKSIRVSQRGSYTLAIRNNSDSTVTVTGTVNY